LIVGITLMLSWFRKEYDKEELADSIYHKFYYHDSYNVGEII